MKTHWKFIFRHFLLLRLVTLAAAAIGLWTLPFNASCPYANSVLEPYGNPVLWSWANCDGVHYLVLSEKGYNFGLSQAYFPLYFTLIRVVNIFLNHRLLSGLLISHTFFILSLGMLYKLLRLDLNIRKTRQVLKYIIYFPTSFFFLSVYTESVFLFLLVACLYFARTKQWARAGLTGILLTLTRIVGIFIVPALFYEMWKKSHKESSIATIKKYLSKIVSKLMNTSQKNPIITFVSYNWRYVYVFIPMVGLLGYMAYLNWRFQDPLLFAHVQSEFGAGRQTDKLVLMYQVFWRYLKMIMDIALWKTVLIYTIWLELLTTIGCIYLLIIAYIKKVRISYLIFAVPAVVLPTLTGTFSSMPRYVLIIFPAFIALALLDSHKLKRVILPIFIILLVISTALFTRGYWIG